MFIIQQPYLNTILVFFFYFLLRFELFMIPTCPIKVNHINNNNPLLHICTYFANYIDFYFFILPK